MEKEEVAILIENRVLDSIGKKLSLEAFGLYTYFLTKEEDISLLEVMETFKQEKNISSAIEELVNAGFLKTEKDEDDNEIFNIIFEN